MRIIVDMDEVLADFIGKVVGRWNALNGTKFTKEGINVWRMEQVLGVDSLGRPAEGLIDEWIGEDGFFEDLELIPGAKEGFERLRTHGHDLVIATSIPKNAVHSYTGKRRWMAKHFPDWPMKNFIACSRKGLIQGDMLIDDGSHNIADWVQAGKDGAVVLDAAWNQEVSSYVNGIEVYRAYDWQHVLNHVDAHGRLLNGRLR